MIKEIIKILLCILVQYPRKESRDRIRCLVIGSPCCGVVLGESEGISIAASFSLCSSALGQNHEVHQQDRLLSLNTHFKTHSTMITTMNKKAHKKANQTYKIFYFQKRLKHNCYKYILHRYMLAGFSRIDISLHCWLDTFWTYRPNSPKWYVKLLNLKQIRKTLIILIDLLLLANWVTRLLHCKGSRIGCVYNQCTCIPNKNRTQFPHGALKK